MIPLPIVAATAAPKTRKAAKLKNAAQATAHCGRRTRVETMVAIEFAASWKPFMKSKASATNTRMMSVSELMGGETRYQPRAARSRVLEHDALDDVRDILAAVGDRLEVLVDRAQLDQLAHVGLVAEQARDRRA